MESNRSRGQHFESYAPHRQDNFRYYYFTSESFPFGALLARKIQAESYANNRIVRPEGLICLDDGTRVLSPDVTTPSGIPYEAPSGSRTEYALGIEKGTVDLSPVTGQMVSWRKFYAPPDMPLEALPAYQFSREVLWPEGEQYLQQIVSETKLVVAEPEGLGKTVNAGRGAVKEFIRNEVQRAYGHGEVWFMGLVEKTVYGSWVRNWGPSAVRRIGESKKMPNPHNYDDVALVPTIMDIDNFYVNMARDILSLDDKTAGKLITDFVYMSDGVSDSALGPEIAEIRYWAQQELKRKEQQK